MHRSRSQSVECIYERNIFFLISLSFILSIVFLCLFFYSHTQRKKYFLTDIKKKKKKKKMSNNFFLEHILCLLTIKINHIAAARYEK